jgi:hypothetical protein
MPEMYHARFEQCPRGTMPERNDAREERCPRKGKDAGGGETDTGTDTDTETESEAVMSARRYWVGNDKV